MRIVERMMATSSIRAVDEDPARAWHNLRVHSSERIPRHPAVRFGRWLLFHWKPALICLAFWTIYSYACLAWLFRAI